MSFIRLKGKFSGDFVKNASILTLGTTIAQACNFLIYPILGRIYSVDEFARLATLVSVTSILSVVATGKYEFSIITATTKKDAINISALSFIISLVFLSVLSLITFVFPDSINYFFRIPNIVDYILIGSLCTIAIVIFNIFNEWCVLNKYFKDLSYNKINNSLAVSLSKLIFGIIPGMVNGLIFGDVIGRWISAFGCKWRLIRKDRHILKEVNLSDMKRMAKRYIEFPQFILPAQLINTLASAIPVFFIGRYYSSTELGHYSMAMNILILPVSLISNSVRDVFRQKAATVFNGTGDCRNLIIKLLKPLSVIGFIVMALVYCFVPDIFTLVLGEKWRTAGEYTQILMIFIYVDFIATSFSAILIVVEKTKELLKWQIFHLAATLISLYSTLIWDCSIQMTLISFTCWRIISYSYLLFLSYKNAVKR